MKLRTLGKVIFCLSLLGLGTVIGIVAYENQEVIVKTVEKFYEFFFFGNYTGNDTQAEWIYIRIRTKAEFRAPRFALRGITVGKSQTVYLINSTVVSNKIHFQIEYTVSYQNINNPQVVTKIKAQYVENEMPQTAELKSDTFNPTSSGQSRTVSYDLLPGSSYWNTFAGSDADTIFYWEISVSGEGSLTGNTYSDEASGQFCRGDIETTEESVSAEVTPSYSISSFIMTNYTSLVLASIVGIFLGIIITGLSPVKPDIQLKAVKSRRGVSSRE
ncbi:MAG: hypothetical protein DRO40_08915 [Thermoprotei archaeon]|nr:MAG: hypothetical protein DRO40_08915 [Thermoprotei archaeon]